MGCWSMAKSAYLFYLTSFIEALTANWQVGESNKNIQLFNVFLPLEPAKILSYLYQYNLNKQGPEI